MTKNCATLLKRLLISSLLLLATWSFIPSILSSIAKAQDAPDQSAATTYRIHFQGRLLTPGAGAPKPDGVYPITFALYTASSGGNPIWSETKNVTTSNGGAFSTLLGDITPLVLGHFNGQDLWLGIKVSADAEATPRQRIAYTPYALYAPAAGNAATLGGSAPNAFAAASHTHAGSAITSGTVAEARIDAAVARDSEVVPLVTSSGAFAPTAHTHAGSAITSGTVADARIDAALARDSEVGTLASASGLMAPKTHSHLGDTWSGTDTFLKIEGATGVAPLIVSNSTFGNAIQASSAGPTVLTSSTGSDGFQVSSAADDGLQVTQANYGLYVVNANTYGILVYKSGQGMTVGSLSGAYIIQGTDNAANDNLRFSVERATGHVRADGSFLPGGADFAEMLSAVNGLTPGDVLVIGVNGKLTRSTTINATNLAGVYSTRPGVVGGLNDGNDLSTIALDPVVQAKLAGEETPIIQPSAAAIQEAVQTPDAFALAYANDGKVPLAVVGVVPVKASAENGAIQPGDLLTTSATPGHAMKASPVEIGGVSIYRPGTILGKALEPLVSGTGVISVLLVQR